MTEPSTSGPDIEAIGRAFRALREDWAMSVEDLAAAAGITEEQVEAIEAGRDELRWDVFCGMADALEVGLAEVADRAERS
jgi:transcriptional regulator with XRE-family HTH domain